MDASPGTPRPAIIPASPDGEYMATVDVSTVVDVLLDAGYSDPRCDVYRFWEHPFPLKIRHPIQEHATKSLLVRCPAPTAPARSESRAARSSSATLQLGEGGARVLVFIGSFGPRTTVEFELNATMLGLSPNATATDAETSESVQCIPRNESSASESIAFAARLDRHSYRMILVS